MGIAPSRLPLARSAATVASRLGLYLHLPYALLPRRLGRLRTGLDTGRGSTATTRKQRPRVAPEQHQTTRARRAGKRRLPLTSVPRAWNISAATDARDSPSGDPPRLRLASTPCPGPLFFALLIWEFLGRLKQRGSTGEFPNQTKQGCFVYGRHLKQRGSTEEFPNQ